MATRTLTRALAHDLTNLTEAMEVVGRAVVSAEEPASGKAVAERVAALCAEKDGIHQLWRRQALPHAAAAVLLAAGATAELVAFLTGSIALVAAMVALISVGAFALAYGITRHRIPQHHRGWLVAAGVTASTWLTLATLGITWPMVAALLLADAGFGARWWREHRVTHRAAPRAPKPASASGLTDYENRWVAKVATNSKGIQGAVLSDGHITDASYTWTVETRNGETLADAQGRVAAIAALMKISASALQFDPLPLPQGAMGDESMFRMQIVTASPVVEAVDYEVPTITDGCVPLGRYADGQGIATAPTVVRGGVRHIVVIGSTGSGKSSTVNGAAVSLRANYPVVTLYFDPKGDSSPDLRKHATIACLGRDNAEEFTRAVERLCEGRGYESALADRSVFTPSADHPICMVILDECDMLFGLKGMAKRWGIISKTGRSKGVLLVAMSQYGGLPVFGGDELLRSNLAAGTVVLMRTASNTSDQLIAPGLPPSRHLPPAPGYAYLQAEGARKTALRTSILRSSDDADPGQLHVGDLLARYPDAPVDQIGRVALGELLVPPAEREAANRAMVAEKLAEFLAGDFTPAPQITAAAEDSGEHSGTLGEIIDFPGPLVPDVMVGMSGAEHAVYAAIKAGHTRPAEIQRATGYGETHVSNQLRTLMAARRVHKAAFGRYLLGAEDDTQAAS